MLNGRCHLPPVGRGSGKKAGSGPSDASDPELGSGSGSIHSFGHTVTVIQRQCYAAILASGPPASLRFLAREKKTSGSGLV